MRKCEWRYRFADDGGYILIYVMVVIVVLSILATSICTSAVHNLKAQQHSVEHMKFVYEVEGIGERFVSELQRAVRFEEDGTTEKIYPVSSDGILDPDRKHSQAAQAIFCDGYYVTPEEGSPVRVDGAIVTAQRNALMAEELEGDTIELLEVAIGSYNDLNNQLESRVKFRIVAGDSSLESEILVTMIVEMRTKPGEGAGAQTAYEYKISKIAFEYLSYEIGSVEITE
ncbi:MAG: hypothetical protein IJ486_10545 [Firmicutes bacterium]|nr:hypothetical protein [Bacillota bacterium]